MEHNDTFPVKQQSGQITHYVICRLQIQNTDLCPRCRSFVNQPRKLNWEQEQLEKKVGRKEKPVFHS